MNHAFCPIQLGHTGRLRSARLLSIALCCGLFPSGTLLCQTVTSVSDDQTSVSITPRPRRPSQTNSRPGSLRLDVNLVLIPVLVTDLYDRPVRGLSKENFRLVEGGVEQKITHFYNQDSPISIGLIFDASNSMRTKFAETRKAVSEFLRMATPGDEFFLLKFSDHPEHVTNFTTDISEIEDGVDSIRTAGWTSLFDAIYLGMDKMKHAKNTRKVLLILSDGGDNNSRYTESEIKQLVKEADVRIFAISILYGAPALEKITEESGGRALRVRNLDELPDLASNLSEEIHSEYVLGYSPAENQRDGKYRKVKVDLLQPTGSQRLRTSWKRGYYGPVQ